VDRQLSHDEVAELLGAYALDAVDPEEAVAVEVHLAACPRCTAEVAQHRAVAGLIANAGVDAPTALWDRIAARIDRTGEPVRSRPSPLPSPSRPDRSPVVQAPSLHRPWRRTATWSAVGAVAAAAVVAVVVLAVQVDHLDQRVTALEPSVAASGVAQQAQAALLDPAAHRVTLTSTADHATQAAVLVILPSGTAYAINTDMPRLASDQTYQLWGFVRGRPVSLGVLGSDPLQVAFSVDPAAVTSYAVTDEVAGGAPAPTHAPLAQSVAST